MGKFKDYKRAHKFLYPGEKFKKWVNKENYSNHYLEDWNALMELADECLKHAYIIPDIDYQKLENAILDFNKERVYKECIVIIKAANKSV